jgi:hypothetical protein
MITHIVCWKYKDETTDAQRAEHIAALRSLSETVPGIESLAVGADIMHLDRSFDTGLVATYASREALDAYAVHPEHQKVVAIGREIAERAVSVDFES